MYFNRKNAEQKNWRMIKKGKHFLFGCSLVFAIGAALATPTVQADTAEAKVDATVGTTQAEPNAEGPTYAAPAATSPVATEAVEANSATTAVSVDKSQLEAVLAQAKAKNLDAQEASVKAEVEAAIAEAEALVANGSASQDQINQSVERLNQAVASVNEVTQAADSSNTPKVRSRRAVEGSVRSVDETNLARAIVTKDNFESFFQEGGTASYDKSTGTIKLTDDVSGQVGSAYLRFKINSGQPFTFTGKVDIGNKYEGHKVDGRPGGDGVGFVFHTGKVDTIGQSGASIGMGTIKNAFGFKLDSWHNTSNPNANQNASADPKYGGRAWESNAFGSFYSSNNAGKVTTSSSAAKALNPAPSGQWVDFKIEYDKEKNFTVTYGSQTWTTNLKNANTSIMTFDAKRALTTGNPTFALSFLGSTGSGTNLQRVQIEKFEFTAPQIVHMKFVDAKGNEIEASSAIPGDENEVINLSTQDSKIAAVEAKGYKLKRIDASKAPSYNEGNNTVTLTPGGQLLTYVFAKTGPTVTPTLQVNGVMTEPGIKSTDNTISGTGEKGATIKIAAAGKTIVDNVTVAEDGSWSATLPTGVNSNITDQDQLVPRDTLTVTQTINGEESAETEVKVGLGESVVQPSESSSDKQSIVAETTTVTLKVPHDAGIAYFDYPKAGNARSEVAIKRDSIPGAWTSKDESKAVVKSYSTDGFFDTIVLEMKEQIQPGKAKVVSNIKEGKYTSPVGWKEINVEAKPADTTPPAAPTVNPVTAASTAVTGTAEPGSTVEVTLPNGSTVSAKADQDGNFSVPVSGLEEGKTVSVTATDAAGNKSTPTSVTVPDTTAPAAPTVNPVKAGATAITGTAEAGSTVEVTLQNGQKASAKAGENGEFSIPVPALNADDQISVTATDAAKNTSTPTKVTVKETVRPTLHIPYDDPATQAIYVYSGEENNIELKVTDNSGKIVKAYLALPQDNRSGLGAEDTTFLNGRTKGGLYLKTEGIHVETTATESTPAIVRVTGEVPKNTYTESSGQITRYLFAEDAAGNTGYEHVGDATTPGQLGRIRFMWKPQTFKYTAVAPSTPITSNTVPEASVLEKAVKDANPTFSDKIESVSVDGTNVKVTYKDGSTDLIPADSVFTIEPTAPTVTPVKNPSSLEQAEKDAVKKAVETANPSATKVEVGTDGTTTLTYSNGSTAKLTPAQTVSQADVTAPEAPSVNPVKAGDTAITGKAEPGSTVEVTLPGGAKKSATAGEDGTFSIPVAGLNENDEVSVTATDAANNTSAPTTATVGKAADKTAPEAPSVNPVKAGDTAITGKAEPGSTVEVTLPGGAKKSATAGEDGTFSIPVAGLNENDEVSVTATDAANNTSAPTTATVGKAADKTAPEAPSVNPVKAGDTAITGKAEPGSTVEVTLPGGAKKSATAGEDGTFSIPVAGLNENDEVSVTATDAANNTSAPTTATVGKAADKTAPEAPSVNPVKAGDTAITGKAEPGSTVEVTLPGGAKKSATAGEDGTFSIPVAGLNENDEVSVTATDAANNTSAPTTATVGKAADKTAPEAPSVNPVKAGDTAITGKAEPGSTVEVTLPGGAKKSATAGEDGSFSIPVAGLNENDEVSVTATDAANNTSAPTTATVGKAADKTAPEAPSVNPVKAGDTAITGKAEPGSTVEVTLPGGAKKSATAGEDGTFSIPVAGLNENDEVSVTATDAANNTSAPTTATVGKAADKTAPEAPSVNPVKAGDTAITGKAEPGSTVEVTLPGGAKKSATAGEDGTFSIPVAGLNENDEVSVTATDAANNTSAPTTATVGKAADKTAPEAPSVNPVKAGDTAITGKAEPGSTVEVTLPGGAKKSATAGEDGTFSIPVAGLNENDEVSVTATDAANNTSAPTTATVGKAADKTAPEAPSVNPVKAGDTAITGKAEPGSTVEVTLPGGAKKSATAGEDGSFSIPVAGLNENDEVSVTATDAANNTSAPTTATVGKAADKTAPEAPSVNPVKAGDTAITGKAEPGSTVEVTLPGGAKKSATAGEDGTFSIPVAGLNENDEVSVTATDAANNTSAPTTATVGKAADKTAPEAPSVNPVKAGDTAITGKAEPGSTVEVTLPGGAKKSATAGEDGTFSIPVAGLNENDEVSVTATDAANNTSAPTTATVGKAEEKAKDADGLKAPETKTPVKDTANLTDAEKAEVKKAVEAANPGSVAEVGQDGTTKVTFPDKSEGTLTGDQTVKAADANGAKAPEAKTPVKDPANLTEEEKTQVAEEILKANPTLADVDVANDGTATVTFPDGSKATLTPAQTVVKAEEKAKDADGLKVPETKTPVKDTANLTDAEKAEVKKAVEAANPGSVAEVGQDGTTKVTFPDKSEATLTPEQTVVKAEEKAKDADGLKAPETKTPVKDTANLTDAEKAEVKKAVEAANPGSVAEVGQDGTTKVTFPDKSEGTLTGDQTVKAADANGAKAPEAKTPVKDPANLTEEEKTQVAEEILKANPTLADVDVANDGTATVTFPDGSKATLTPAQTVVKAEEKAKDADGLKVPETKTPVKDTANLTDAEKAEVKKAVEAANPGSVAEVGQDGTTKVTFPDKSEATLTPEQTVVKAEEKAKDADGLKAPETKTPVKDTANLTDAEKAEVKKAVEAANPGSVAEVGQDGTTKVTFADKSEATLTPEQTVVKAEEKAKDADGLKAPETKTPVKDTANLTDAEKAEVKKAVEAANPGSVAEVGQDGTTKVTFPDGSKATLTPAQTVVKDDTEAPAAPDVNPVKAGDKVVTGKAEPGSSVEVTLPDGTKKSATAGEDGTFSIPVDGLKEGDKVSVTATDAEGNTSGATDAIVAKAAPAAPVVNDVKEGDKAVTGTAEPGSIVEITLPNSETVTVATNEAGLFYLPIMGLKAGDKVTAVAKDASGNTSTPTEKTVGEGDAKGIKTPVVNPVKAGDTAITGTAEAGSTVEVTLPDGTKATATADKDGKFSVPVAGLKAGDKVSVTATDVAGNKSGATDATVAPTAPVVNPVKAGDTAVTGTAEAGSTVEVILPDGTKAIATAGKDGKFSIPVAGLKAGDKVSVTATDAAGNKSGATDATVAPSAPVVNPVKAGDTAVTGTAEAGSTVEVILPDGTKAIATADKDGKFSIPVAGLKAGDKVSVTATDAAGNKSGATDATVAPSAPVVNPVKAGDTAVTGTAEAGSTVEVTLPDGTKATATADKDGKFSIPVAGLKAGDKVSVTATDAAGNKSGATDATVAPSAPVVNPVKAGDTAVTGTAEAGSTVEVTLPDGTKATATADKDGKFNIPVAGLKAGDKVSVTATDAANNTSAPTTATVGKADDKTAPEAPSVNPVKAGDKAITGTAEAGSTVEVTLPDGTKATATADKDGKFSIPVAGLKAGDKVSVTATDAAGNKSGATDATVAPAAPVVNPVKAGDTAITGTAEAGSTVEVTLPDGTKATATADKDGKFSIPVAGLKAGDKVSVTATDAAGNKSGATDATVALAAPVVNPVKVGDTAVTGTAEAGSTVEVTLPDGTKATATADKDGKFSIPVAGLKAGDKVSVTATDAAGNKSGATDATVAPAAPVVNPVKAGDTAVTGTAEAGSTVEVTLPDGTKATATADKDGKFSIPVAGLKAGDKVSVTATDAAGNKSGATDATVAPAAPVVNPVKAGDTAVTGTAEAGSTVEVTLPDGTKATATADKDGKFSVPVAGLKAGDKVSVTATDAAGNKSGATDATVAKATPTAPSVNDGKVSEANGAKAPALTPVVDSNNLTDAEKAKIAEEVKKANPTATDIKVNNDGSVVVTFADGSVAVIASEKAVKEATKESSAKETTKKAGAKELPNTGTEQSNASLGLALLVAVTGGLLIAKKRKEEE